MAKSLIIVESPTKTKTLKSFLGSKYVIEASMGHVRDLPQKEMGVDIEGGFAPKYVRIPERREVLTRLAAAVKKADTVFLASDPDREGEAIAWHLAAALKLKAPKRIEFNEITRNVVLRALETPRDIDAAKVDAQEARRILDRLVGYRLSPLLWKKVRKGLSAGRVQSVVLRLVVDREREILAFVSVEYWSLTATLSPQAPSEPFPFEAKLIARVDDAEPVAGALPAAPTREKLTLGNQAETDAVLAALEGAAYRVASVAQKEQRRNPQAPFTTSTLQQEAARKLGFSNRRAMATAQALYEGIDLGPAGVTGLITYMRTDSPRVSAEAQADARDFVRSEYGDAYLPKAPPQYKSKGPAQDAHEAVRPTSVGRTPDSIAAALTADQLRLYRLIWQRFVASQMSPARFDVTTADIEAAGYVFRATGSVPKFDGFMRVYTEGKDTVEKSDEERDPLPPLSVDQVLDLLKLEPKQHFTEPPPRYTEATLVKALDEKGIGRPSTWASFIATIQDRGYVVLEERRFRPTDLGFTVNDLLVKHFPAIMDVGFTADMETKLDEVEVGSVDKLAVLRDFYTPFEQAVSLAHEQMERVKPVAVETDFVCPKCGKPMVLRQSERGPFLGCTGYPKCKTVLNPDGTETAKAQVETEHVCPKCGKPMVLRQSDRGAFLGCSGYPRCRTVLDVDGSEPKRPEKAQPNVTDQPCPKCGEPLVERSGRFGKFLGCSAYPKCRTIVRLKGEEQTTEQPAGEPTGVKCPKDGGEVMKRVSRKGAAFYGCSNYPQCDFTTWHRPIGRECPDCGWPLGEKQFRGRPSGAIVCANPDCGHEEKADA